MCRFNYYGFLIFVILIEILRKRENFDSFLNDDYFCVMYVGVKSYCDFYVYFEVLVIIFFLEVFYVYTYWNLKMKLNCLDLKF